MDVILYIIPGMIIFLAIPAVFFSTFEGWNYVEAPANYQNMWFTAFRYRAMDTTTYSHCMLAEVAFEGILGAVNATCPVQVQSPITT